MATIPPISFLKIIIKKVYFFTGWCEYLGVRRQVEIQRRCAAFHCSQNDEVGKRTQKTWHRSSLDAAVRLPEVRILLLTKDSLGNVFGDTIHRYANIFKVLSASQQMQVILRVTEPVKSVINP